MEMDELNLHPSMLSMVCLLKHLDLNGISPSSSTIDMPPWMICLYKKFHDATVPLNIKPFLMRLVTHTHRLFRPHARFWLTPILQLLNQLFETGGGGLNTFIIDTLVIALSWHSVAIPSDLDALALQKLLASLFLHCQHPNSMVMRSNLDLIKKLIELWKDRLVPPTVILHQLIANADIKSKENAVGLNLFGLLLANGILPYHLTNDLAEEKFNETLLKNMKNASRSIYAAAAEVVGMLLKVRKEKNQPNDRLLEQLTYLLKYHSNQTALDTYVTCVYSIQKHYPDIVDRTVMNKLIFGLKKFYGDLKMECLQAMMANIQQFELIYVELRAAGLLDILQHKDFAIRTIALKLIYQLLSTLTMEQLNEIGHNLAIDGPTECQYWTLEINKWIYDRLTSSTDTIDSLYDHVREQLLQFLSSKNESLRVNCRNFWSDPRRLSTASHHRLIALVGPLYSSKTELDYLHYSTNFLLERTSHNPDYQRTIFEHPLDECQFQDFPLNCHWRQRYQSYTTPLFTQADQGLPLLQTQEINKRQEFLPTQVPGEKTYNWLKQSDTFDPSTAMTQLSSSMNTQTTYTQVKEKEKDEDKGEEEIFRLKRRFLKDTGQLHSYFARQQNEKKAKEKQFLNEVKLKESHQVEKYRQYRIGELPDIQIRFSDLIIPLQVLAQSDHQIARILFSSLFTSIVNALEDLLTDEEFQQMCRTAEQGFHRIFSQSEIFFPSFIASIFDILLSKSDLFTIPPSYLSSAAMASQLEPLGILTLEASLRRSTHPPLEGPMKKKLKTTTSTPPQAQVESWLELAKCARSIGNYDDVRGIFAQLPQLKPVTLKAMEEESHSDFLSALNSYITALEENRLPEDPIVELEHEFWTQSMLNCCNQLSQWKIMSKHIFLDSVTFETLWSDVQQLKCLMPFAIRSKLKLLITGSEQEQLEQEDLCQFFTHLSSSAAGAENSSQSQLKRSYLEKNYPFELATFFLYQKDFDRSKYYLHYGKEQFFHPWSTLSRLNDRTRQDNLQWIQPYHELDQFLQFIDQYLPLIKSLAERYAANNAEDQLSADLFFERFHQQLISSWRLPSSTRNSILIWDDVITNRSLFLDVIDDLLGGPRTSFTSRLKSKEFDPILIELKTQAALDMANCALEQGNFKLALTKLTETRARLDQCENAQIKSIDWHEIYCHVHLKRHQTSVSSSTLPSLLSTLVAKELKKLEPKLHTVTATHFHTRYLQLNAQFCRTVIDALLIDPQAYRKYEEDPQISASKHQQLEFYLDHPMRDLKETTNLLSELFRKEIQLFQQETSTAENHNALVQFCDSYLRDTRIRKIPCSTRSSPMTITMRRWPI